MNALQSLQKLASNRLDHANLIDETYKHSLFNLTIENIEHCIGFLIVSAQGVDNVC